MTRESFSRKITPASHCECMKRLIDSIWCWQDRCPTVDASQHLGHRMNHHDDQLREFHRGRLCHWQLIHSSNFYLNKKGLSLSSSSRLKVMSRHLMPMAALHILEAYRPPGLNMKPGFQFPSKPAAKPLQNSLTVALSAGVKP